MSKLIFDRRRKHQSCGEISYLSILVLEVVELFGSDANDERIRRNVSVLSVSFYGYAMPTNVLFRGNSEERGSCIVPIDPVRQRPIVDAADLFNLKKKSFLI